MTDAATLATIVLMASGTYLTRILGYLALRNRELSPRMRYMLESARLCVDLGDRTCVRFRTACRSDCAGDHRRGSLPPVHPADGSDRCRFHRVAPAYFGRMTDWSLVSAGLCEVVGLPVKAPGCQRNNGAPWVETGLSIRGLTTYTADERNCDGSNLKQGEIPNLSPPDELMSAHAAVPALLARLIGVAESYVLRTLGVAAGLSVADFISMADHRTVQRQSGSHR